MRFLRQPPRATAAILVAVLSAPAAAGASDPIVGRRPPAWSAEHWINSPPLELDALRGRVVLVRWWTAPGCPFCRASAPTLRRLHQTYEGEGLVVVGLYHHKSSAPLELERVFAEARDLGFDFPVAVDPDWRTLDAWWLSGGDRSFTSVSFLLDRAGVVRWIHAGGAYAPGSAAAVELESRVRDLLEEPTDPVGR